LSLACGRPRNWTTESMIRQLSVALLALPALTGAASAAEPSPYAGWQERHVKALSRQQLEDYLEGRGMGMALPAEVNGYPGPRHVLELADELDLTADQLAQTRHLVRRHAPEGDCARRADRGARGAPR
jgi:hypothetical protein